MRQYLLRKLLFAIPSIVGASLVVFLALRVVPGDPAQLMLGDMATAQDVRRLREEMGLNAPLPIQYVRFLTDAVRGDLGRSVRLQEPVVSALAQAFPVTVELAVVSLVLACVVGVTVGIVSAVKQHGLLDGALTILVLLGISMPAFWSGLLLLLTLGLGLGLFPIGGALSDSVSLSRITGMHMVDGFLTGNWKAVRDSAWHLVLPAITLATVPTAVITRMMRSSMLEVLRSEYVTTARSKGLRERAVLLRHTLKNALIPVVTVAGLQLGYLLGGAVVTEQIFDLPGIGLLAVTSILHRDYPVVQGIALLSVVMFVGVNLFVDVLYAYLNPQIRFG